MTINKAQKKSHSEVAVTRISPANIYPQPTNSTLPVNKTMNIFLSTTILLNSRSSPKSGVVMTSIIALNLKRNQANGVKFILVYTLN